MRVTFGPWAPDQPDLDNGLEDAVNCVPLETSYGPFPDANVFSSSLTGRAQGAYATRDTSGAVYTFAGDATTLYKSSLTGWDDVSRLAGGAYAVPTDGFWEWTTFGNTVLAGNGVDAMQVFTLGTSTDYRNQSASASAPVAGTLCTARDFVFAGRIASALNRLQWCQINNPLRWTASPRLQSDSQDIPDGGSIVAITGGDFVTVLTDYSVHRLTYVGSPVIWRRDEVAPGIGCIAHGSAARYQNVTYFLSQKGVYAFDGAQAIPIGDGFIDRFLLGINGIGGDFNTTFFSRVSSVIDPVNKLYVLSYPSTSSTDGTPDRMLLYNWGSRRWTRIEQTVELIFAGLSPGYTLDSLDGISGSLDALPFSLDSRVWMGGNNILSGFDAGHRLVNFDGAAKTARYITGETQLIQDFRAFLSAIRPLVQGTSSTAIEVLVGKRNTLNEAVTWTSAVAANANGVCPLRADARFHRIRMDVSGSFTQAIGFDLTATRSGRR